MRHAVEHLLASIRSRELLVGSRAATRPIEILASSKKKTRSPGTILDRADSAPSVNFSQQKELGLLQFSKPTHRRCSNTAEHTPGSPEALAEGCTCDPLINAAGRGALTSSGQIAFMPANDCPLHGGAIVVPLLRNRANPQ